MRVAVDRYVQIGRNLMRSGQYDSAEGAFNRAVELSGNQRLDLIEDQTRARVMRIYDDPQWRGEVEEDIREADFVYLLALESFARRCQAPCRDAHGLWCLPGGPGPLEGSRAGADRGHHFAARQR